MKKEKLLDFDKNLTFGVEIELTKAKLSDIKKILKKVGNNSKKYYKNWNFSPDYMFSESIGDEIIGGEIKTPILKNKKGYFKDLKYVLENLKEIGAEIDGGVGLHYHVSAEPFELSKENILKFLELYVIYEHIIYKFGYNGKNPRKVLTCYAEPIRNKLLKQFEELKKAEKYGEIIYLLDEYSIYKKQGINFWNILRKLNTIEFRMCNGSLDYNVIKNEIDLFCNLVLSSQKELDEELIMYKLKHLKENPTTLEDYSKINMKDAIEFSDMIFSSDESKNSFIMQYTK